MREAAEVVKTLWPNGNEGRKEIGPYSFVIDKPFALEWASNLTLRSMRNTVSLYSPPATTNQITNI